MPIDIFEAEKINFNSSKKQPIDIFEAEKIPIQQKKLPIESFFSKVNTKDAEKEFSRLSGQALKELPYVAQGAINEPGKMANVILPKGMQIPKLNIANKLSTGISPEENKIAEELGGLFGMGLPRAGAKLGYESLTKGGKFGPKLKQFIESSPMVNSLLGAGGRGAELGLYQAAEHPENSLEQGLLGAGAGTGLSLATNALFNPYVRQLAALGAGGALGYSVDHPIYGLAAGAALPGLPKLLGLQSKDAIAQEMIKHVNPREAQRAMEANRALGTETVTPGQAIGSPTIQGLEGEIQRTVEGKLLGEKFAKKQLDEQKNSLNRMMESIYKPTEESENAISNAYKKSEKYIIKQPIINKLKDDLVIKEAFDRLPSNNALFQGIGNLPEGNAKYLDRVKYQLDDMYQSAISGGRNREAKQILESKNNFLKTVDKLNPEYKKARELAQPQQVRKSIEEKFNKNQEEFTAKNFYSKFLNNPRTYSDILKQTKNFPEARDMIVNMRRGWKEFSNPKKGSSSAEQAKTAISQSRNFGDFVHNFLKDISGARGDIKRLEFIYGPNWDKSFDRISKIKDARQRQKELISIIGQYGLAYGLNQNQIDNVVNLMTEDNK